MLRVEPRSTVSWFFKLGVPLASAILSLFLAAIPLAFAGADISLAYQFMIKGVFGSIFSFSEMLTRATPLIFTGLAATIAFRARLWNIGAEGQLYLGAMAAVAVGTGILDISGALLLPIIILFGCVAGSIGMVIPVSYTHLTLPTILLV